MIDKMIEEIEAVVCIRKIWRCNAGWGMLFVLNPLNDPRQHPSPLGLDLNLRGDSKDSKVTAYAYYGSLSECVKAEHAVWVKKQPRPARKRKREPRATA